MDMAFTHLQHWPQPLQTLARWLLTPMHTAPHGVTHAAQANQIQAKAPRVVQECAYRSASAHSNIRPALPTKRLPLARRVGWSHRSAVEGSQQDVRPALRVFMETSQKQTGRLAITGRMADVCAELDRLAEREQLMSGAVARH